MRIEEKFPSLKPQLMDSFYLKVLKFYADVRRKNFLNNPPALESILEADEIRFVAYPDCLIVWIFKRLEDKHECLDLFQVDVEHLKKLIELYRKDCNRIKIVCDRSTTSTNTYSSTFSSTWSYAI